MLLLLLLCELCAHAITKPLLCCRVLCDVSWVRVSHLDDIRARLASMRDHHHSRKLLLSSMSYIYYIHNYTRNGVKSAWNERAPEITPRPTGCALCVQFTAENVVDLRAPIVWRYVWMRYLIKCESVCVCGHYLGTLRSHWQCARARHVTVSTYLLCPCVCVWMAYVCGFVLEYCGSGACTLVFCDFCYRSRGESSLNWTKAWARHQALACFARDVVVARMRARSRVLKSQPVAGERASQARARNACMCVCVCLCVAIKQKMCVE